MDVISHFAARYERTREEELSLEDYLAECKRNPLAYATAAERMLKAIGEPTTIDTRNDPLADARLTLTLLAEEIDAFIARREQEGGEKTDF